MPAQRLAYKTPYLDHDQLGRPRIRCKLEKTPGSGRFVSVTLFPRNHRFFQFPEEAPKRQRSAWRELAAGKCSDATLRRIAPLRAADVADERERRFGVGATFSALEKRFWTESQLAGRSPETATLYRRSIQFFREFLEEEFPVALDDVALIEAEVLRAFIQHRRASGSGRAEDGLVAWSTIKTNYRCIAGVLGVAVREGMIPAKPQLHVNWKKLVSQDQQEGRTRPPAQFVTDLVPRLLEFLARPREEEVEAVSPTGQSIRVVVTRRRARYLEPLLTLLAFTGARSGEVLSTMGAYRSPGLRWRDVHDLDSDSPFLRLVGGKSREFGPREVPLPTPAAAQLRSYRDHLVDRSHWSRSGPVFVNGHGTALKTAREGWLRLRMDFAEQLRAEGAPEEVLLAANSMKIHDLRHFASRYWRERGVPDRVIDAMLGHRTVETAAHYARPGTAEIASSLRRAEGQ